MTRQSLRTLDILMIPCSPLVTRPSPSNEQKDPTTPCSYTVCRQEPRGRPLPLSTDTSISMAAASSEPGDETTPQRVLPSPPNRFVFYTSPCWLRREGPLESDSSRPLLVTHQLYHRAEISTRQSQIRALAHGWIYPRNND